MRRIISRELGKEMKDFLRVLMAAPSNNYNIFVRRSILVVVIIFLVCA